MSHNKPISLLKVCNKFTKKEEKEFYFNMTEFYVEDYEDILKHQKPINIKNSNNEKWVDVTILDLFNIPLENDKEIINFIKERLNIDIETSEWINHINEIFQKSLEIYEKRYFKTLPIKISKKSFNSASWIIDFLKETKTNKRNWIINCALAKIAYAIDDVLTNEKIRRAVFLDRQFIQEYLEKPFQIEDWYEDISWNIYRMWKVIISDQIIKFKLIARQKQDESIIWKQISDSKYYSVEEFKDLVWVTIYVDSNQEAALMMQYIDQLCYKWDSSIVNKNWIDLSKIQEEALLNEEFFLKLQIQTEESSKKVNEWEKNYENRKISTSENYREVKLTWKIDLSLEKWENSTKYPIWTEIKFVIWWHDNEKGITFQRI